MAEIVRRRSWGGVLPLGRQASISGSNLIQCASVSIAPPHPRGANARHHKQFKREQALELDGAKQQDLVITGWDEPKITVDDIEVAQFIYLLLNNKKIRDVID